MKTIEIVVDEMPESCYKCVFFGYGKTCVPTGQLAVYCDDKRLPDCPLVAWQSSDSAPKDGVFLAKITNVLKNNGTFYNVETMHSVGVNYGEDTPYVVEWIPIPK